jgi:hypothetical protein
MTTSIKVNAADLSRFGCGRAPLTAGSFWTGFIDPYCCRGPEKAARVRTFHGSRCAELSAKGVPQPRRLKLLDCEAHPQWLVSFLQMVLNGAANRFQSTLRKVCSWPLESGITANIRLPGWPCMGFRAPLSTQAR